MNGEVCALLLVMVFVTDEAGSRMVTRIFIELDDISVEITDKYRFHILRRKGTHTFVITPIDTESESCCNSKSQVKIV